MSPLAARARDDVRRAVNEAVERDALEPDELRALAQALRDLASDLCERAGRADAGRAPSPWTTRADAAAVLPGPDHAVDAERLEDAARLAARPRRRRPS